MAEVIASISRIEGLITDLQQTVSMLRQIPDENARGVSNVLIRIDGALESSRMRERFAYENLLRAEETLAMAEASTSGADYSDSTDDIYLLSLDVVRYRLAYDMASEKRRKIEGIKGNFQNRSQWCLQRAANLSDKYSDTVRNGTGVLERYLILLRKSQDIIGANGGHRSQSSADSNTTSGILAPAGSSCGTAGGGNLASALGVTQQTWVNCEDDGSIYDSPVETGTSLDANQGKYARMLGNGSKEYVLGTCGVVSCVNVLRLAGIHVTEEQVVEYALANGLCSSDGGTSREDRQKILKAYGLDSVLMKPSRQRIANCVASGQGVIISVYSSNLWYGISDPYNELHAVTVTSVKMDRRGNPIGFFVCDSGSGFSGCASQYYTAEELMRALSGKDMNVTSSIIR